MNTGLSRYLADAAVLGSRFPNYSFYLNFLLTSSLGPKTGNNGIQTIWLRDPACRRNWGSLPRGMYTTDATCIPCIPVTMRRSRRRSLSKGSRGIRTLRADQLAISQIAKLTTCLFDTNCRPARNSLETQAGRAVRLTGCSHYRKILALTPLSLGSDPRQLSKWLRSARSRSYRQLRVRR